MSKIKSFLKGLRDEWMIIIIGLCVGYFIFVGLPQESYHNEIRNLTSLIREESSIIRIEDEELENYSVGDTTYDTVVIFRLSKVVFEINPLGEPEQTGMANLGPDLGKNIRTRLISEYAGNLLFAARDLTSLVIEISKGRVVCVQWEE